MLGFVYLQRAHSKLYTKFYFTGFGSVDLWYLNFKVELFRRFQIKEKVEFKQSGSGGKGLGLPGGANGPAQTGFRCAPVGLTAGPARQRLN